MTTVAIVQARMGSSRLPGKVLKTLGHQPTIAWVVDGASLIPGVDRAVVATSDGTDDDAMAEWCASAGVRCHRGAEDDVLARFLLAAEAEDADTVIRITGDCPLIDPQVCGLVLARYRQGGCDYAANIEPRSWPDGLDCEVFSIDALRLADKMATSRYDREHVTPFIRNNRHLFQVRGVPCPASGLAGVRWTLDTQDDFDLIDGIVTDLGKDARPGWLDILFSRESWPGASRQPTRPLATVDAADSEHPFARSEAMLVEVRKSIPLGTQTFSKSAEQFPKGRSPLFLTHGDGAFVWDVDGNRYVDMISGLLSVLLGYRDPDVDQAIRDQLGNGISFSLATELETELASRLIEEIPCAEMIRFGKNGTDATSAAVRIARAATGRDEIAVGGYHGWQDWYVATTTRHKGVPEQARQLTHRFAFNDIDALRALLEQRAGKIAAIIVEPVGLVVPDDGYLAAIRALADEHGALLVFDEIITGFRFGLGGAQRHFGVTPDLAAFGKALGNGMPIAVLAGKARYMAELEEVFISATFGGETLSLASAIAVIDKMRREPVAENIWSTGERLGRFVEIAVARNDLESTISLGGLAPWRILAFRDGDGATANEIKTLFIQEMIRNGVLIAVSNNITAAMGETEVSLVETAYDKALSTIADAIARGDTAERIGDSVIQPVFSVR